MATVTSNYANPAHTSSSDRVEQVATILKWTYGLVPIAAGADKFAHMLTDWDKYLAPIVTDILPMSAGTFMAIVGIIEIVAGIIVLVKPRIGSLIVAFWLIGIVLNLLLLGQYFDVAVRDVVMAIGAFCLFLLLKDERRSDRV
jgi:uncharacterized membrane protein YphA (DoxX/SURF4 family)